jgi:hypothetical protein
MIRMFGPSAANDELGVAAQEIKNIPEARIEINLFVMVSTCSLSK